MAKVSRALREGLEGHAPRLRRVALAALVFAMPLAACAKSPPIRASSGGSVSTTSSTVTASTAPDTSPTTVAPPADLIAELLGLQDLPPGWSQFTPAAGAGPQNRGCLSALTSSDGRLNRAEAQFQGGTEDSEYVDEILESFGPGGAPAELVYFRQVVAACTEVTVAASGVSFTGRITTIALPTFGDDSTAYRVDLTTNVGTVPITLGYGLVIARRADTVLVIVASDVDPAGVVQLLQQTAGAAMARIT